MRGVRSVAAMVVMLCVGLLLVLTSCVVGCKKPAGEDSAEGGGAATGAQYKNIPAEALEKKQAAMETGKSRGGAGQPQYKKGM